MVRLPLLLALCAASVAATAGNSDCEAKGCGCWRSGPQDTVRAPHTLAIPSRALDTGWHRTAQPAPAALLSHRLRPPNGLPHSFTGLASCGDCELLAEIVKDGALTDDCKACCVKEAAALRYGKAVLELCPFKKSGLPQVRCTRAHGGGGVGGGG